MSEPRKISDTTVSITGIIAWLLLAFASLKLAVIYAPNPLKAYLITYNIASFIFLLYFYGYFKLRFTFGFLLLLVVSYNFGINVLHVLYDKIFLIRSSGFEISRAAYAAEINLVVMILSYGVLYLLMRPRKT